MAQLNEDLFIEILPWLSVESLLRFRCVSKSVCAVIDSSNFINLHLSKSSQNFNLRKLVFQDRCSMKFHVWDVNLNLEEDILRIKKPGSSEWRIVGGNCKGLLLLYRNKKLGYVLWNPSTRQYRDLPEIPLENPPNYVRSYSYTIMTIMGSGLGYDDCVNDYKAVLMVRVWYSYVIQVWIYGLKTNSWKRAQDFPRLEYNIYKNGDVGGVGCFADGSLHWLATRFFGKRWEARIVAFDVRNETFSLIPVPDSINSFNVYLHVLEECLCISHKAELYMLKKDGVDMFTWTKLFSITEPLSFDIDLRRMNVLGYSKRGDKILLHLGQLYMVSYDLKEKSFSKVELHKHPRLNSNPILCVQSLVSLGGGATRDSARTFSCFPFF